MTKVTYEETEESLHEARRMIIEAVEIITNEYDTLKTKKDIKEFPEKVYQRLKNKNG